MSAASRIVIIDYGSGNLRSAAKAFERAAADIADVPAVEVTSDAAALARASHVVLPGVGAFADCMAGLAALDGMVEALEARVRRDGAPFLGICVGMQLLATVGEEHGRHDGLGWLPGRVTPILPNGADLKVPHMGWNELSLLRADHPVVAGIAPGAHAYFVHSYAFVADDPEVVVAETDYGGPRTAIVARDNVVGTQFHPEKSQATGLGLIRNFIQWRP